MLALVGFNANAAIYMIGDAPMGGWGYDGSAGIEMTDNGDGTYSCTVTIGTETTPKTVYFAFADGWGTSWNDFNANHRYGPQNGGQLLTSDWASVGMYGDRSFTFIGTGDEYVVTFDLNNLQAKISGNVAPIEITTYSVVGNFNNWDVNSTDDIMTLTNGVYTLSKKNFELQAGTFVYKFIGNHDYGIYEYPTGYNNLTKPVEKHGYYDIDITFVPETQTETCTLTLVEEIVEEEDPIYTVAGSSEALFGGSWDPSLVANEMTKGADGIYTWTKENVALTAGTIEFKVVLGHAWGTEYPASNWIANIEADTVYNVTITFNPSTQEITFSATVVEAAEPVEDTYVVAGSPAAIFTNEWEFLDANKMTLGEDGLYVLAKEGIELTANTKIEYKVVKNNSWATCYPSGPNAEYIITEDGVYDLLFTFNTTNDYVNVVVTKQGEDPEPEIVYTVAGPAAVFGTEWDVTDTNNDMVLDAETNLYTWTADSVALTTAGFGFKVVANHAWGTEWPAGYDNNWIVNIAEDGLYNLVITFNPATEELNCVATLLGGETPEPENVYTVAGPAAVFGNDWDENYEANNMTLDEETGLYTWTKEGVELTTAGFGFKVVANHDWSTSWPNEAFANYDVAVEEAGIYTIVITFDADNAIINCVITKTADIEPVHYDGDVYIMGEVNGNGWATNVGVQMTRDAENNVYTATITTAGENVPEGEEVGYSYFSFTKQLVDSAADWDGIAPYRFGAASTGDFWVTDELLGTEITLQNNGQAFRIPAGEWNLTLSVDNMTLVITKVEAQGMRGDVDLDGEVGVSDITALLDAIVTGNWEGRSISNADCDLDDEPGINDVTALLNYLLTGNW